LAEADIDTLTKAFSQKLGKKVAFRVAIDPSLLAGMKVTVNGVTYDGTLRSQIHKLRDHLAAGLPRAHA
jgi:F0F1-type ATP synthase delta subunit